MPHLLASAVLCAALAAPPAAASASDRVVVFAEDVTREPFAELTLFPCLGAAGQADDEALLTGTETRHVRVTAAGADADGNPVAPYFVRATIHTRAVVDPVAEGLPDYAGSALTVFRDRVGEHGATTSVVGLFKARAGDGETLAFRFRLQLVVSPDGTVRIDRMVAACAGG